MHTISDAWRISYQNALEYKDKPWLLDDEDIETLCLELYLDESYMREHRDLLKWSTICLHQKMSYSFIREMDELGYIKWWQLSMNDKMEISEKLIEQHLEGMGKYNLVHWDVPIIDLFINRKFSKEFFMRNYCYIDWENVYKVSSYKNEYLLKTYSNYLKELGIKEKFSE